MARLLAIAALAARASASSAYTALITLAETQADATIKQLAGATTSYPSNGVMGKSGWLTSTDGGWTSGFFPAHLLNLHALTGDAKWLDAGSAWSWGLAEEQFNTHTHDVGFMLFTPYQKLWDATQNMSVRAAILQTAASLSTRYSAVVGCTRSWDSKTGFEVIADNLMNLELLWWAAKESGNKTFYDIADSHVDHMLRDLFQPAPIGAVWHLIVYNQTTGGIISRSSTPQGLGLNTVWSRGQSWVVNGLTIAYRYSHKASHLEYARAAADFFIAATTECCANNEFKLAPLWDFNTTTSTGISVDTSALMIATSGIIELATHLPAGDEGIARYLSFSKAVLDSVSANYLFTPAENDAMMRNGTVTYPLYGVSIIYGDYFLLEAVMRWDALPPAMKAVAV